MIEIENFEYDYELYRENAFCIYENKCYENDSILSVCWIF